MDSLYKGVNIVWDQDRDNRVLHAIDLINHEDLIRIAEHEGCLELWWKNQVPYKYRKGECLDVGFDHWTIVDSSLEEI